MTLNIPNLDRLISLLGTLPEEKFSMAHVFTNSDGSHNRRSSFNECGTAACIAGWTLVVMSDFEEGSGKAKEWLGLDNFEYGKLFMPKGWSFEPERYPLSRALRTLRHLRDEFLRTGNVVVDWDAPEAVEPPRKLWAAPVVIGVDKPLPAELTRLVREPVSAATEA